MHPDDQKPVSRIAGMSEGRIIHYVAYNDRHLAGMVIGYEPSVEPGVDIVVFTNMLNVNGVKNFGQQFHESVKFSESCEVGTCHYPERV